MVAKMGEMLGGRDPKSVRFSVVHEPACAAPKGGDCLCTFTITMTKIAPKMSKASRRLMRRAAR